MDDPQLLVAINRLSRQIRTVKLILGFFFVLFLLTLAVLGFIAYRVITFTQDINTKINNFENKTTQSLDVKKQLCGSKSLTSFLGSDSKVCD